MANPQKENGHTAISNELLEAICRCDFTATELKIIFFTIRKTYGYHKKIDNISIGQYELGCNIPRRTIIRTLNKLVGYRTLVKDKISYISSYGIQKNYDLWLVTPMTLVTSGAQTSDKTIPKLVSPRTPTKETKETKERRDKLLTSLEKTKKELISKKIIGGV